MSIFSLKVAFHPGSYIEDILNITQAEFAERLGASGKTVSKNVKEIISKDIANKLAKSTDISIKTWLEFAYT